MQTPPHPPVPPVPPDPSPSNAPNAPFLRAAWRPAAVLAGVGTFLLTAASISFVAARWDRFGPGGRFAALLGFSAFVFGCGFALRRVAPTTARSLDVLTAALVPVDVAGLAIVGGASWPAVLLVSGPVTMLAAEVLRSRDRRLAPVTALGTVSGGVLLLAGVAAGYDVALPPMVAVLGLAGCVAHPWSRERLAGPIWAALAGLAPALRVLDDVAFTGNGTMRRFGLLDATPWEATLLAGTVAAGALAIAAVRRRNLSLGLSSSAVTVTTAAAMWAEHQPPRSLLIVAAAIVIALAEIALADRRVAVRGLDHAVAVVNAAVSAGVAAMALSVVIPEGVVPGVEWAYAAGTLAFAWIVRDLRTSRAQGSAWADVVVTGPTSSVTSWAVPVTTVAAVTLAASPVTAGVVAVVLAVAVVASGRRHRHELGWSLAIVASALVAGETPWVAVSTAAVAIVLVGVVVVAVAADRREPLVGRQLVLGALAPIAVSGGAAAEWSTTAAGVAVAAGLWLIAVVIDAEDPATAHLARAAGLISLLAITTDDPVFVAWSLGAAALLLVAHHAASRQRSSAVMSAASAGLAVGLSVTDRLHDPLVVFSLMLAVAGVALAALGLDRVLVSERGAAAGLAGTGGFMMWWASLVGLAAAGVVSPEPYLYPVLLGIGVAIHTSVTGARDETADEPPPGLLDTRTGWFAVGVPLGLAGVLAFAMRIGTGNAPHLLVYGGLALSLAIIGGWQRVHPALVLGAGATVAVGTYAALDTVVGIESWSWLVISGAIALTVAALLEIIEPPEADLASGPSAPAGGSAGGLGHHVDDPIDVDVLDDQRGTEGEPIADPAEDHSRLEHPVSHLDGIAPLRQHRGVNGTDAAVAGQDAVAHERVEPVAEPLTDLHGAGDEPLALHDLDVGERGGRGRGVAAVGVAVPEEEVGVGFEHVAHRP